MIQLLFYTFKQRNNYNVRNVNLKIKGLVYAQKGDFIQDV